MNTKAPEVLLRLGSHAEKEYFLKMASNFDGFMFGANLLESTAGATASLVCKLCGNIDSKPPYYIDPMTYAFGSYFDSETGGQRTDLDWIKSDQKKQGRAFKRSYGKLADQLGSPFTEAVGRSEAITPNKIMNVGAIKSVLDYQRLRLRQVFEEDDELQEFVNDVPQPGALFTPYFYQEPRNPTFDLSATLEIIRLALESKTDIPVHAIICADVKHLEDQDYLDRLAAGLEKVDPPGVWLWFSRFDEYNATYLQLKNFRDLVARLGKSRSVINMHGSFFSLSLWHHGLNGIMHGVGYGEQKDVVPVIGQSTPWVSYYLSPTHSKLTIAYIERCFRTVGIKNADDFHASVCDCAICKGILRSDLSNFRKFGDTHRSSKDSKRLSQTPAAAKRCRFHFLLSRMRERDYVAQANVTSIAADLEKARVLWTQPPLVQKGEREELGHLLCWKRVLSPEEGEQY